MMHEINIVKTLCERDEHGQTLQLDGSGLITKMDFTAVDPVVLLVPG